MRMRGLTWRKIPFFFCNHALSDRYQVALGQNAPKLDFVVIFKTCKGTIMKTVPANFLSFLFFDLENIIDTVMKTDD